MREMAGETQSALGMLSETPGSRDEQQGEGEGEEEEEETSMKQAAERKQAGGNSTVH